MEKPNIFALATKELSQDAFFTWLLQSAALALLLGLFKKRVESEVLG